MPIQEKYIWDIASEAREDGQFGTAVNITVTATSI